MTGRALRGHRLPERGAHPLSRHLDQPQLGHRERLGARPVASQMGAQLLEHLVPVAAGFHVRKVHAEDAADVAQPQVARRLRRRLDIGLQDRALGVLLARVATRVHVDRGEGLGRLDDQVAPGRELHPLLEETADLRFDVVLVEQRGLGLVQLHPVEQVGVDLLQVLHHFSVQHLRIDEQRVDLVREEVASAAARERLPLWQRGGPPHRPRLAFVFRPKAVEVLDFPLAALLRQVLGDGADDPPARPWILGNELRDHLAQLGALFSVFDLAGDTDFGGEWHINEEPPGQRDLRGDARSLGADRFLDDLDDSGFAALQLVRDVWQPAPGRARAAVRRAAPATVVVVVIGRLVFVFRLDQVRGVEKGALFRSDVDERGLYPRKHGLDRAEVDIAHHAAGIRTIHQELNKAVVLQDRDASLACGPADENFPFQSKCPRPRSANSRSGSYDCSSKNSCQADRLRMSLTDWTRVARATLRRRRGAKTALESNAYCKYKRPCNLRQPGQIYWP